MKNILTYTIASLFALNTYGQTYRQQADFHNIHNTQELTDYSKRVFDFVDQKEHTSYTNIMLSKDCELTLLGEYSQPMPQPTVQENIITFPGTGEKDTISINLFNELPFKVIRNTDIQNMLISIRDDIGQKVMFRVQDTTLLPMYAGYAEQGSTTSLQGAEEAYMVQEEDGKRFVLQSRQLVPNEQFRSSRETVTGYDGVNKKYVKSVFEANTTGKITKFTQETLEHDVYEEDNIIAKEKLVDLDMDNIFDKEIVKLFKREFMRKHKDETIHPYPSHIQFFGEYQYLNELVDAVADDITF